MASETMTGSNARNRSARLHSGAMKEFRERAAVVKRDARDLAATVGTAARQQLDPVRQYIAEKPLQSLLIAGGIGLLLGLLRSRH
jgi:ElaB/YqjD/DUF883 family membrane-anchored ribosome-binding protein